MNPSATILALHQHAASVDFYFEVPVRYRSGVRIKNLAVPVLRSMCFVTLPLATCCFFGGLLQVVKHLVRGVPCVTITGQKGIGKTQVRRRRRRRRVVRAAA